MTNSILRGLLWREWRQHGKVLCGTAATWLVAVWIVPVGPHVFLLPFGIIAAALLGWAVGGADAREGVEEFAFALPPTRSERYLVRLGLSGVTFLALQASAIGAFRLGAPQSLWGLIFQTGYTEPFAGFGPAYLYGLSLALPAAIFGEAFASGSLARSPGAANAAWLRGLLIPGALLGAGFVIENWAGGGLTGLVSCPLLATWAAGRLSWAYLAYRKKEGIASETAGARGMGGWVVAGIVLALLGVLFVMTARVSVQPSVRVRAEEK